MQIKEFSQTESKDYWIGFVYTFPAFRGKRLIAKLIDRACSCAKEDGYNAVYVSTDQKILTLLRIRSKMASFGGLYEKLVPL